METENNRSTEIIKEVKDILIQSLRLDTSPKELDDDIQLFGGGLGLDSLRGLRIVMAIERHYGFKFKVTELNRQTLKTVGSLSAIVAKKLDGLDAQV